MEPIDRLAALAGIETAYDDAHGVRHEISARTIRALLAALGFDVATDAAAARTLAAADDAARRTVLAPVTVVRAGAPLAIRVGPACVRPANVRIELEDGTVRAAAGREASAERLALAVDEALPLGYHRVALDVAGARHDAALIVVPQRCWRPPVGERAWGLAVQLYGLRGADDRGLGDFSALGELAAAVAAAGGAAVGTGPLHELPPFGAGASPSPYAPTSRLALEPAYADPARLTGARFDDRDAALDARLAAASLVDWPAVRAERLRLARLAFDRFTAGGAGETAADRDELEAFERAGGAALRRDAVYRAIASVHGPAWPAWPAPLHDPDGAAVIAFAAAHAGDVAFGVWLQWQTARQLEAAVGTSGLALGRYGDLAVGAARDGVDAWARDGALLRAAAVGAPPDLLNREGQCWGVAPFDPRALRCAGYAPFAALVRASMRSAGALRIDHVMGLRRLWLVPDGFGPADGGYVGYPLDDLLGVLALESVRARCLVVGEDLGTVPEGFREATAAAGVLSYRLLQFEVDDDVGYAAPETYPELALATVGTHDLPPLGAYVAAADVTLRRELRLIDDAREREERAARARRGEQLARAFAAAGLDEAIVPPTTASERAALGASAHAYLGATPSLLAVAQVEDVLGSLEQPNLPTTVDEHPNWRRRAPLDVTALVGDPRFVELADVMRAAGRAANVEPSSA